IYFVDLDGVVYRGSELIEGADRKLLELRGKGKVIFLTNNSTKSRREYALKLNRMGIPCDETDIVTSSYAAALYITGNFGRSRVYPVGEYGLTYELWMQGHSISDSADVVVAGLDRSLTYRKLAIALANIRNGAKFIATNRDATMLTEHDILPGAGAIVAALETACGISPVVVGKPETYIVDSVLSQLGASPGECTIIGDRLETDILLGKRLGMRTVLVLSGVSKDAGNSRPDVVVGSLAELEVD
ncbi:MAG TPA: HAD-IIA family hydrolase, partial [Candidatus Methanoperedenaceae archaeon]|nr:HAD-IIA family hydrolase [Candidatus Methanoperedenaceae archaeon]